MIDYYGSPNINCPATVFKCVMHVYEIGQTDFQGGSFFLRLLMQLVAMAWSAIEFASLSIWTLYVVPCLWRYLFGCQCISSCMSYFRIWRGG